MKSIKRIELLSLLLLALAFGLSLVFWRDRQISLGVLIGGVLATANFWGLRRIVYAIVHSNNPRRQFPLAIMLTLKFGLLAATLFAVIKLVHINVLALLVGISVVVAAIMFEGFRSLFVAENAGAE